MTTKEPLDQFDDNENYSNQEKEIIKNLEQTLLKVKERAYGYEVLKTGIIIVESNLEIIDEFNEKTANIDLNTTIEKKEQLNEIDEELLENLDYLVDQVSNFIKILKEKEQDFSINEALKYTDIAYKQFGNNQKIKNYTENINAIKEGLILCRTETINICSSIWMRLQIMGLIHENSIKFSDFKSKFRVVLQDIELV